MEDNINKYYDEGHDAGFDTNAYHQTSGAESVTTEDLKNDSFAKIAYDYEAYEQGEFNYYNQMEQKRKAHNKKCIISLILMFAVPVVMYFISSIFSVGTSAITSAVVSAMNSSSSAAYTPASLMSTGYNGIGLLFNTISSASKIAALVLMIVARVQYKEGTFGKVLMWIYITKYVLGAILVLFIIILLVALFGVIIASI